MRNQKAFRPILVRVEYKQVDNNSVILCTVSMINTVLDRCCLCFLLGLDTSDPFTGDKGNPLDLSGAAERHGGWLVHSRPFCQTWGSKLRFSKRENSPVWSSGIWHPRCAIKNFENGELSRLGLRLLGSTLCFCCFCENTCKLPTKAAEAAYLQPGTSYPARRMKLSTSLDVACFLCVALWHKYGTQSYDTVAP